jgi:pimeloyl-ACP methyl ester carboxylesterase
MNDPLRIETAGHGAPIWFVHGQIAGAQATWSAQASLADRWRLVLVSRPGYGSSPAPARSDWLAEGGMVASSLTPGAHLVGHSYGALVVLAAAAQTVAAVKSLTLLEAPAYSLRRGDPEVERLVAGVEELQQTGGADLVSALKQFMDLNGITGKVPDTLSPGLESGVRLVLGERLPWDGELPLEALRRAPYPKLVFSGGGELLGERVADALATAIGAERKVLAGGHNLQRTAGGFNDELERFLLSAERAAE